MLPRAPGTSAASAAAGPRLLVDLETPTADGLVVEGLSVDGRVDDAAVDERRVDDGAGGERRDDGAGGGGAGGGGAVDEPGTDRAGDRAVVHGPSPLGDQELAVLALERRRYRHQGAKEQAVRDELGLSATRYYQVLNALLDDEAALAHDPVLVARLRRLRDARTALSPA